MVTRLGKPKEIVWLIAFLAAAVVLALRIEWLASVPIRIAVLIAAVIVVRLVSLPGHVLAAALIVPSLALWASYVQLAGRPAWGTRLMMAGAIVTVLLLAGIGQARLVEGTARAYPATALAAAIVAIEFHPMSDVTVVAGSRDAAILVIFAIVPVLAAAGRGGPILWGAVTGVVSPAVVAIIAWAFVRAQILPDAWRTALLLDHYIPSAALPCGAVALLLELALVLRARRAK